ncbi:MAG TPA: HAMP domain-containing sensor histidine kinase [Verrucomicrobiae bacterium]|nr:HAMP domain-containing sensor histidine kinase [Verrucomicrobiae bacterium]
MNRPLHTWLLFGGCLLILLAGMAWATWTALRLDRAHAQAQQKADFEEKVRLALWRMDSTLAPLIVQESSRPYFTYNSFYAAERAYNRMFGELKKGEVLVPSPLLTETSTNVLLHFQLGPNAEFTSPQVPASGERELGRYLTPQQFASASARLVELRKLVQPHDLFARCAITLSPPTSAVAVAEQLPTQGNNLAVNSYYAPATQIEQQQVLRNNAEMQARSQTFQQAASWNGKGAQPSKIDSNVAEGTVKPIWLGDALVLARRVMVNGQSYIQGCWLNWNAIRQSLLNSVQDLLPGADLLPAKGGQPESQAELLAALPLRLIAPKPRFEGAPGFWTPVRLSLAVAWACVLLAAAAVAGLLHGTVSLSERRADFVSAVTHELRTPLTTFKMYSEMLSEGMVQDEEKRKSYLSTLCAEANRLSHLVENVLAYARLERGSARSRIEKISLGDLLDQVKSRLLQRAEHADMRISIDSTPEALATSVHVDVSVVEQIVFNLVDNACKYAAPAAIERLIHIEALSEGKSAMLRVRDHGQGISAEAARRLFRPFSKSATEAAHSAPGIGLGLALCRRLSRSMGGDLRFDASLRTGACFELRLPTF